METVRYCILHNADISLTTREGLTPRDIAERSGNPQVVRAIDDAGSPPAAVHHPPADSALAGVSALERRDYTAAIEALGSAIALDPDNQVLYSHRSKAHAELGNIAAALSDAERCVELVRIPLPLPVLPLHTQLGGAHSTPQRSRRPCAAPPRAWRAFARQHFHLLFPRARP